MRSYLTPKRLLILELLLQASGGYRGDLLDLGRKLLEGLLLARLKASLILRALCLGLTNQRAQCVVWHCFQSNPPNQCSVPGT